MGEGHFARILAIKAVSERLLHRKPIGLKFGGFWEWIIAPHQKTGRVSGLFPLMSGYRYCGGIPSELREVS